MMNILKVSTLLATIALVSANSAQAFEVLKAEDTNSSGLNTRSALNLTKTKEQQFLSNFDDTVGTEEFENLSSSTSITSDLSFSEAGTASFSGSGEIHNITDVNNEAIAYDLEQGLYAASGNQYLYAEATPDADETFAIDFSNKISGFGFYAYDLGDWGAELSLKLYDGDELVATINNLHTTKNDGATTGSAIYVGILGELKADETRETFDRIEFTTAGNNIVNTNHDIFALDNMTIATASQIAPIEVSSLFPD